MIDFYSYDQDTPFWKGERINELFEELKKELGLKSIEIDQVRPFDLFEDKEPFLHIHPNMVRIRRLNRLTETKRKELVKRCDEIYGQVMMEDEEMN
jgi:hypothetical protein